MAQFLYILLEIVLPIMILIIIGFVFQKALKTDSRTFSRIMMYMLIPTVIFTKIYRMDLTGDFFLTVVPFIVILEIILYFLGLLVARLFRYKKSRKNALTNAYILINTGNYGIPLIELVFKSNPIATASQLLIIVTQNITSNTFGVFHASAGRSPKKEALKNMLKMPALYVLVLVAIVKLTHLQIPKSVMVPLDYLSDAFIAIAVATLGVQLAEVKTSLKNKDVWIGSIIKIILTPAIGFGIILLLGVKGILAQALLIGISTPTAVNSAIIAREFDNEPDFAAQFVLVTTILCTFSLPVVIYLAKLWL